MISLRLPSWAAGACLWEDGGRAAQATAAVAATLRGAACPAREERVPEAARAVLPDSRPQAEAMLKGPGETVTKAQLRPPWRGRGGGA